MNRITRIVLALGFALLGSAASAADCQMTYTPVNVCKRCTTVLNGTTSGACSGYAPNQTQTGDRVLLESKITRQPRNGRASVNGPTWTYTPKAGFAGRDVFTLERNLIKDGQLFVYYLQINLDVKP